MGRGQANKDVNCPVCGGDDGKCPSETRKEETTP
jgi:hypothetical protein